MPIKSFRGSIDNGDVQTIALHTNNGSQGYRIKKLDVVDTNPGAATKEVVMKVYSVPQSTVDGAVNFSDQTLLAVGVFAQSADSFNTYKSTVFDNVTFNQDIYVTCKDSQGVGGANYYIELELVRLDLTENTVATLKDIRNI